MAASSFIFCNNKGGKRKLATHECNEIGNTGSNLTHI